MICEHCKWEADIDPDWAEQARELTPEPVGHDACKGGTHCMCQHRKPVEDVPLQ
jgi:hypothetical protein